MSSSWSIINMGLYRGKLTKSLRAIMMRLGLRELKTQNSQVGVSRAQRNQIRRVNSRISTPIILFWCLNSLLFSTILWVNSSKAKEKVEPISGLISSQITQITTKWQAFYAQLKKVHRLNINRSCHQGYQVPNHLILNWHKSTHYFQISLKAKKQFLNLK